MAPTSSQVLSIIEVLLSLILGLLEALEESASDWLPRRLNLSLEVGNQGEAAVAAHSVMEVRGVLDLPEHHIVVEVPVAEGQVITPGDTNADQEVRDA